MASKQTADFIEVSPSLLFCFSDVNLAQILGERHPRNPISTPAREGADMVFVLALRRAGSVNQEPVTQVYKERRRQH
jgi:hypothetical protein